MSTNTLKQALEIVYGDIKNINKRVKNIESASIGVLYNETTKSAVAYQDNVSANACPYALLNIVGGMSYKCNNLCSTATYNDIMNNTIARSVDLGNLAQGTYTISFNVVANNDNRTFIIYYVNNGVVNVENSINTGLKGTGAKSFTFTLDNSITYDDIILGINTGTLSYSIELNNLMLNAGSTALPYQPYFEDIRDTAITSVVSKDSNDNILAIGNIPNEIQALEGYGWGINDTCYNYIDLVNKKFIQKVRRYTFTGNENWINYLNGKYANVNLNAIAVGQFGTPLLVTDLEATITNRDSIYTNSDIKGISINGNNVIVSANITDLVGKTFYYELAIPIETDISQYINDNSIQISANGTITFGNIYQQAIPYEYLYLEKVGANNE